MLKIFLRLLKFNYGSILFYWILKIMCLNYFFSKIKNKFIILALQLTKHRRNKIIITINYLRQINSIIH